MGISTSCTDITTINDDIYEENETFFVSLSSTNEDIDISLSTATVQIMDNDGKYY